jgi:hypothetical protein
MLCLYIDIWCGFKNVRMDPQKLVISSMSEPVGDHFQRPGSQEKLMMFYIQIRGYLIIKNI